MNKALIIADEIYRSVHLTTRSIMLDGFQYDVDLAPDIHAGVMLGWFRSRIPHPKGWYGCKYYEYHGPRLWLTPLGKRVVEARWPKWLKYPYARKDDSGMDGGTRPSITDQEDT